jgi:signal transduction histidine kinase/ligand-binding sensor domain-containing protein
VPRSRTILEMTRLVMLCLTAALLSVDARALTTAQHLDQSGHIAWRLQDGAFQGAPTSVAQDRDGYIWIGTESGLVRFDGVRFVDKSNDGTHQLIQVTALLGARNGDLYVGADFKLWRYRGGIFKDVGISARVEDLKEDSNGVIWAALGRQVSPKGPLCSIDHDVLHCFGPEDGLRCGGSSALAVTQDTVWLASSDGVCRWPARGQADKYFEKELQSYSGLAGAGAVEVAADGTVFAGITVAGPQLGLLHLLNDRWQTYKIQGLDGAQLTVSALYRDRENALWIGTSGQGLFRVHDHHADHVGSSEGLTADLVSSVFEDREGLMWVTTPEGLDCFRALSIKTISQRQGLTKDTVSAVLADQGGGIWASNSGGLDRISGESVRNYLPGHGLPGHDVTSLFQDDRGRMWVGIDNDLYRLEPDGRFTVLRRADGHGIGVVQSMTTASDGTLWAQTTAARPNSMHLVSVAENEVTSYPPIAERRSAVSMARTLDGTIWMGLNADGGLARLTGTHAETVSLGAIHLSGAVRHLLADPDGSLWAATHDGILHRTVEGRLTMLSRTQGLPCNAIYSLIFDGQHGLWASTACGYLEIEVAELQKWLRDPKASISVRLLGSAEGSRSAPATFSPPVTKTSDGRLWFATDTVIQVIDPRLLVRNSVEPTVRIESLSADGEDFALDGRLRIPPQRRRLEIDFTGLSFTLPQRVHFRYRLLGYEPDWSDVGTRRAAFYTDLPPGHYRFEVLAANNDGLWSQTLASVHFSVDRAWFQTWWFRALCVLGSLLVILGAYRLRIRQLTRQLDSRIEERLSERTRIGRDLHDTMLQTLQGSRMVAEIALNEWNNEERRQAALIKLQSWLKQAVIEGRAALNSLLAGLTNENDLPDSLKRTLDECAELHPITVHFTIEGAERPIHPLIRDEISHIGSEAIRNACMHSGGTELRVTLSYAQSFALTVADNGVGIGNSMAIEGSPGHFGIRGMRERANRIQGVLTIVSNISNGTTVQLQLPGRAAYRLGKAQASKLA